MGLLTVSKKLKKDHPEIVQMTITWLEKECNAEILKISEGEDTQYYIEGEDIPVGDKKFDVLLKQVVPQVFSVSVRWHVTSV